MYSSDNINVKFNSSMTPELFVTCLSAVTGRCLPEYTEVKQKNCLLEREDRRPHNNGAIGVVWRLHQSCAAINSLLLSATSGRWMMWSGEIDGPLSAAATRCDLIAVNTTTHRDGDIVRVVIAIIQTVRHN